MSTIFLKKPNALNINLYPHGNEIQQTWLINQLLKLTNY